jgi:hypothetical protein
MSEESKELFEKAKNMSLDEAYDYCRKLEYDREYSWRDGLQGGFESSMHSYDNLVDSFEDPSKIQILSDNGKGKEYICASESAEAVSVALSRLPRRDRPFAEAVLQGKTWREMGLSRQGFWKRVKKIETFFAKRLTHPPKTIA